MTIVAVIALIGIIVGVIAYLNRGSNSAEVLGSEGLDAQRYRSKSLATARGHRYHSH